MKKLLNIVTPLHKTTERDYLGRMTDDKVKCMKVAKLYGHDYWDGDRRFGYGGYKYDGRQAAIAQKLVETYGLNNKSKILDVGCGKGFLLYEIKRILPGCDIKGFDVSDYAVNNSKEEIRSCLFVHKAEKPYPFKDKEFDLAVSLTTLHNLATMDLEKALHEFTRVGKNGFIVVESYRNEQELFNLQCWALTCASFLNPDEWVWLFNKSGYHGDYEFIYFE